MHLLLTTKMKISTVFDITSEVLTFLIILLIPVLEPNYFLVQKPKKLQIHMYETFRKKKLLQNLLKSSYSQIYRRNDINQSAKLPFCKKEFTNVQGFYKKKKIVQIFPSFNFRSKLCVLSPNSNSIQTFIKFSVQISLLVYDF